MSASVVFHALVAANERKLATAVASADHGADPSRQADFHRLTAEALEILLQAWLASGVSFASDEPGRQAVAALVSRAARELEARGMAPGAQLRGLALCQFELRALLNSGVLSEREAGRCESFVVEFFEVASRAVETAREAGRSA